MPLEPLVQFVPPFLPVEIEKLLMLEIGGCPSPDILSKHPKEALFSLSFYLFKLADPILHLAAPNHDTSMIALFLPPGECPLFPNA